MSTDRLSVRVKGTKVQDLRRIELTFSRSKIHRVANRKPGNLLTCNLKVGKFGPDADGRSTDLQSDRMGSIPTVSTK